MLPIKKLKITKTHINEIVTTTKAIIQYLIILSSKGKKGRATIRRKNTDTASTNLSSIIKPKEF